MITRKNYNDTKINLLEENTKYKYYGVASNYLFVFLISFLC